MKKIIIALISGLLLFIFGYETLVESSYFSVDKNKIEIKQEIKNIPILFIGDMMLGRYVEVLQNKKGLNPFSNVSDILSSHVTVANLEGPIPTVHKPTPTNGFSFSFASSTAKLLKNNGISAVSLANNHALDQRVSGYENTKLKLKESDVSYLGNYDNSTKDYFETKIGTTTVIVFGINMISSYWNQEVVFNNLKSLRSEHKDAYLIAFIHWGNEYDLEQGDVQRNFAHKLINSGVNAIIGSHPHVTQGIEVYKNSPIFYSLGNFVFDQYFSIYTERGLMVSMDKIDNNFTFNLIPVTSSRSLVSVADEKNKNIILETLAKSSSENLKNDILKGSISIPITQ